MAAPIATGEITVSIAAQFDSTVGEGGSEVVAHETGRLYVTNGAEGRIDVFDIAAETKVTSFDLTVLDGYDSLQSVAVKNGVVAAAIARPALDAGGTTTSQPGFVAFFDAATGELLSTADVGNLPDSIAFTHDGSQLVVAGEGEFNEDSETDDNPLGTIAVIDTTDAANPVSTVLDFTAFTLEDFEATGLRIAPGVSVAEDVEPEYIAISPDGATAYVTLQENNGIAVVDLGSKTITGVMSVGVVDHSLTGLDPNDDGEIGIDTFDRLDGMRMPDAIAAYEIGGTTYLFTANEGDGRGDGDAAPGDEARVGDLAEDGRLDPSLTEITMDWNGNDGEIILDPYAGTLKIINETASTTGHERAMTDVHVMLGTPEDPGRDLGSTYMLENNNFRLVAVTGDEADQIRAGNYYLQYVHFFDPAGPQMGVARPMPALEDAPRIEGLERLTVSTLDGDVDGDGDIDVLHAFGSRSFTIYDTDGTVVWDSGDQFERIIADLAAVRFNNDDGEPIAEEGDNRSDAKGPEPEAITVGEVNGAIYAFIGLERDSGVMIYNVTDPSDPTFVDYLPPAFEASGDEAARIGPETIAFIPAEQSTSGVAQIAVANEISGTTIVYDLVRLQGDDNDEVMHAPPGGGTVDGGAGNDLIIGTPYADRLFGGEGVDTLLGLGGDDTLVVGEGEAEGGRGNDYIIGGSGDNTLTGGAGDDYIEGRHGDDQIGGNRGYDRILAGRGEDVVRGGAGADVLYGQRGDDTVVGNAGDDYANGGHGDDMVAGRLGDDTLEGGAGNDTVLGGNGDDIVVGNGRADYLSGGNGDDFLIGGTGRDTLLGGNGDDTLSGGPGFDMATGGAGADVFQLDMDGVLVITDFEQGTDLLDLDDDLSFDDLVFSGDVIRDDEGSVLARFSDGFDATSLTADDFTALAG